MRNQLVFQKEGKLVKVVSLLLVYTLLSQEAIACAIAYKNFANENTKLKTLTQLNAVNSNAVATTKSVSATKQQVKSMSGPKQAETSGFSINSTDELVNKFTGDFNYSIPLMDVEGYPIVINYNSNTNMNADASWVGFGWDLNLGAISRDMRGVPDEFNGSQNVVRTFHEKEDNTNGTKFGGYAGTGIVIKDFLMPSVQLTALWGKYNNTILGQGKTFDFGVQGQLSLFSESSKGDVLSVGPSFGVNYSKDSKQGIGVNKNIGLSAGAERNDRSLDASIGFGSSSHSRKGLMERSLGYSLDLNTGSIDMLGGSITYGTQTSTPRVSASMIGTSKANHYKLYTTFGAGNFSLQLGVMGQEYESKNKLLLTNNNIYEPAFGYLHSGKRAGYSVAGMYPIMDFNRSFDTPFSEEMKNLPFSIQTYDIFHADGLGISGTFRARRTDIGTYYDPTNTVNINEKQPIENVGDLLENVADADLIQASAGIKFGGTVKLMLGIAAGYMPASTESGVMLKDNNSNALEFTAQSQGNQFDNSVYFKAVGENTPEEMAAYTALNGTTPDQFVLTDENKEIHLTNLLKNQGTTVDPTTINSLNPSATPRPVIASSFVPKTVADYATGATYESYPLVGTSGAVAQIPRFLNNIRYQNHISALEITATDGMRYNYGIPVYSIKSDEVSFASGGLTTVQNDPGLVTYTAGTDNSINNTRGWTGHYDKTEMPAYAHSFLLTEMKSSDYIDRTGDGVSLDDVGAAYKFNYTRLYSEETSYKWRYPVSGGSNPEALQSKGFLASSLDDMAHYTYGEKEIWYAHSIVSKNMIAEFVLENRTDAYGVNGENGGLNTAQPLKLLRKIVLYNRAEKELNPSGAIPLQTVEFVYDYSQCLHYPGNPNTYSTNSSLLAQSGKLTLKKIKVYNGKSKEMALSTYSFEYSAVNPDFNYSNVDAWGNYKANDPTRPNDIYPYAEQDVNLANQNSSAYKLVAINNPTGGRIEISYEADTYAYVQNKRAMKYMDITGMTNLFEFLKIKNDNTWNLATDLQAGFTKSMTYSGINSTIQGSNENNLITQLFHTGGALAFVSKYGNFDKDFVPNNVIVFKLDEPINGIYPTTQAQNEVKNKYFKDPTTGTNSFLKELYFKLQVNVKGSNTKELIPCNAEISEDYTNIFGDLAGIGFIDDFSAIGVMPKLPGAANYEYGYVVLNPVNSGHQEFAGKKGDDGFGLLMHPLQRSAMDYARQNLPDVIYGSCSNCTPDLDMDQAITLWGTDMYRFMLKEGIYSHDLLVPSIVRLFDADNKKVGGGSRVKQIIYKDNWQAISTEYNSEYKWTYNYLDASANGVAAYEPRAMQDENPLYYWDSYVDFNKKFPDETKFTLMPAADALYPNPVVGYTEVRETFNDDATKGYTSTTFYTAKDFPTVDKRTTIDHSAKVLKQNIFKNKTIALYGFTQGYSVETNNFHGQPKENKLFDGNGSLQSRTTYKYYGLGEELPMIDRSTAIENEAVALEYDIHADSRFVEDETKSTVLGVNLIVPLSTFIPRLGPIFSRSTRNRGFYSHALIKHINRSAVVKSIETEYMGSVNTAQNQLYDKYSGDVIVSNLTDEFNDKLYSISYPSHWYYGNLRDVKGISKATYSGVLANGTLTIAGTDLRDEFSVGDQLKVTFGGSVQADAWVLQLTQNTLVLIQENGIKYSGNGTFAVSIKQTNRKNRLHETMQSVVTKKNPWLTGSFVFPTDQIISCGAITYTSRNNLRCGTPGWISGVQTYANNEVTQDAVINPFQFGVKGELVGGKQYNWQDRRTTSDPNGIRFNGTYASTFYPFYKYNASAGKMEWYKIDETDHPQYNATDPNHFQKWRESGIVTVYDEYGNALENKSSLGNYSSILYGFNATLNLVPTAQAVNAAQQDIAFDSFEDYDFYSTFPMVNDESHFDFKAGLIKDQIVSQSTEKHSGHRALMVRPGYAATRMKSVGQYAAALNENSGISNGEFKAESCLCIKPFQPAPNEYLVSVWVKESNSLNKTTYVNGVVEVKIDGTTIGTFTPSGNIIDGWQRLEGIFTILPGAGNISFNLKNISTGDLVYFDDFRIQPTNAAMTTVVYDMNTLLPMATHDAYNFTTFYNYDENYNQVRVKVETEKGIQTVTESESGIYKSY